MGCGSQNKPSTVSWIIEDEKQPQEQTRLIFQISFLLEVVSGVPSHLFFLIEKPLDI